MEIVNSNTQLCCNQSALRNDHRTSSYLKKPLTLSYKGPANTKTSSFHSQPQKGSRLSSRRSIISPPKEDERSIFDAAEAEAISLVRQHQASRTGKNENARDDFLNQDFPLKQARSDLMGENLLGMEINNADRREANTKIVERSVEFPSIAMNCTSSKGPGSAKSDYIAIHRTEASPQGITAASTMKNPFQRARHNKSYRAVVSKGSTTTAFLEKNSNSLPSLLRESRYVSNSSSPTPSVDVEGTAANEAPPTYKNGVEVRSEEMRAATSMKLGDRSPKLPSPSIVSRSPKRPIVRFADGVAIDNSSPIARQRGFAATQPNENVTGQPWSIGMRRNAPCSHHEKDSTDIKAHFANYDTQSSRITTTSIIPSIQVSCDEEDGNTDRYSNTTSSDRAILANPSIAVNNDLSTIQITPGAEEKDEGNTCYADYTHRSLPPDNAKSADVVKAPGYTYSRTGALCNNCALPISGRIVSAAGHRFHPKCFRCYHCGEGLECVAFYPEPEEKREQRLLRCFENLNYKNETNLTGEDEHDNDTSLRFYCHLDFHEFFSPRCKSCKTPIEGEVVVACGAHWHVGHFFCAECGDPFDSSTPFVERDGYAWCIRCHTKRQSAKCKKCKRPVTDLVVKALGAEWHKDCFSCSECEDGFENGVFFLRGSTEKPVCQKCEEVRLKS